MSASLWGCELKYYSVGCLQSFYQSASLWGCELKCMNYLLTVCFQSQPPCEAVSWNVWCIYSIGSDKLVSLLVRLWVEIRYSVCRSRTVASASLWGCELKWCKQTNYLERWRSASLWGCELKYIPFAGRLCRRGSASLWGCELKFNIMVLENSKTGVSLLVRLWVEMFYQLNYAPMSAVSLLVRLWVEMLTGKVGGYYHRVSLLVRLWVEISEASENGLVVKVSLLVRLWVEICGVLTQKTGCPRQPPCVAVSWNIFFRRSSFRSSSQPPCEAVSWNEWCHNYTSDFLCQPPCEAVSWNSIASPFESTSCSSASLSFEMPFWLCYNRHDISQSLWETVNWKEEYAVIVVSARKLTSILLEEDCEINHSHI